MPHPNTLLIEANWNNVCENRPLTRCYWKVLVSLEKYMTTNTIIGFTIFTNNDNNKIKTSGWSQSWTYWVQGKWNETEEK